MEHPRGSNDDQRQWCIWMSAFVKWMLIDAQINTVTFLQGPLGQPFPKPTTMLVGRLEGFAHRLFAAYDKRWRPTECLTGKTQGVWNTSKGKVYPTRLSMVIAQAHLESLECASTEGDEMLPDEVTEAISKLTRMFDAYGDYGFSGMKSDYNPGKT